MLRPSRKQERLVQKHRDVILIFALALTVRIAYAWLTRDTYDYDEFVILLLSRDFAHGAVPYRDFMFFHPPGVLYFFRLLEPLTAVWWPLGRCIMIVVDAGTAGLVVLLGRRLYARPGAVASGVLYAASPLALTSAVRVGQDPLITALGVGGLAILLGRPTQTRALVAGACLGLAVCIKYPALTFLPAYILVARRRTLVLFVGMGLALSVALLPMAAQHSLLYDQTITFQRSRWSMPLPQRIETIGLYWIAMNALGIFALTQRRFPAWLLAGFAAGAFFLPASQVYYHYFSPIVPFGALLGGGLAEDLPHAARRLAGAALLLLSAGWGVLIDLGGPSPLFVTAAHLSAIRPTVRLIQQLTNPGDTVLADRFEYPYLAGRYALGHYFWNVGVLKDARYLEARLSGARAVVLSYGASSGYPAGFTMYLNAHYERIQTPANTVWLLAHTTVAGTGRK